MVRRSMRVQCRFQRVFWRLPSAMLSKGERSVTALPGHSGEDAFLARFFVWRFPSSISLWETPDAR